MCPQPGDANLVQIAAGVSAKKCSSDAGINFVASWQQHREIVVHESCYRRDLYSAYIGEISPGQARLESAHRDHYKSGAHKHCGCDEKRCFKWGHDPVVAHGAALSRSDELRQMLSEDINES